VVTLRHYRPLSGANKLPYIRSRENDNEPSKGTKGQGVLDLESGTVKKKTSEAARWKIIGGGDVHKQRLTGEREPQRGPRADQIGSKNV